MKAMIAAAWLIASSAIALVGHQYPGGQMLTQPLNMSDDLAQVLTFWAPLNGSTNAYGAGSTVASSTSSPNNASYVAPSGVLVRQTAGKTRFEASGYLSEGARTNNVLWSDDFTNVAWTLVNMTAAKTATGPDNTVNSASTLTATLANATALQLITLASNADTCSCWIQRKTGSGSIQLTEDNGVTWTTVTVTSSWAKVSIPTQTLVSPTVGIRIVTNADAVNVCLFQDEVGSFATSSIPTTSAAVTRNKDTLSYPPANNMPTTSGSFVLKCDRPDITSGSFYTELATPSSGNANGINAYGITGQSRVEVQGQSQITAGPFAVCPAASVPVRYGGRWGVRDTTALFSRAGIQASIVSTSFPIAVNQLNIAMDRLSTGQTYGHVSQFMLFAASLPNYDMLLLTRDQP